MKTEMQKSIEQKERTKTEQQEKQDYAGHLEEAKKYVPELQDQPFVKAPTSCKFGVHKFYWFETDVMLSYGPMMSDVKICTKCGVVFVEHLKFDLINPHSMATDKHFMGYGNPNKAIQSNSDNQSRSE